MDKYLIDIVSVIIALGALLVAYLAFRTSKKATLRANDMQMGQSENQIRTLITTAKMNFQNVSIQFALSSEKDKQGILEASIQATHEDVLNAYDEACARYNDNRIDKLRFKKMYFSEIKQLVENTANSDYYNPLTSRYQATIKVYNEWNNLENNTSL